MNPRRRTIRQGLTRDVFIAAAALACASTALAGETTAEGTGAAAGNLVIPFAPEVTQAAPGGLAFDLGGSEVPKLQLQLTQPLGVDMFSAATDTPGGGQIAQAGTQFSYRLDDRLQLAAGAQWLGNEPEFQALGSIHCENGTLDAVSYHASNCYFVDQQGSIANAGTLSLGASYQATENSLARLNLFQSEGAVAPGGSAAMGLGQNAYSPILGLLPASPVIAGGLAGAPLAGLDGSVTGVDLEFQLGVRSGRAGNMVFGLQLTRILEGEYGATYWSSPGLHNWTIAEPFDSARLSFDWSKGAFSGGVDTYYRTPVDFLHRGDLGGLTTFDVHFTWRAPWNASVSVGASNVLSSGADEGVNGEAKLSDPFESVYGRIPYVRYKQDL